MTFVLVQMRVNYLLNTYTQANIYTSIHLRVRTCVTVFLRVQNLQTICTKRVEQLWKLNSTRIKADKDGVWCIATLWEEDEKVLIRKRECVERKIAVSLRRWRELLRRLGEIATPQTLTPTRTQTANFSFKSRCLENALTMQQRASLWW